MNCDRVREQLAESLMEGHESFDLQVHLRDCANCREEYASVKQTWETLGLLPVGEPGPAVRQRFYQTLEAYREGTTQKKARVIHSKRFAFWPSQPAFQMLAAAAMLVIGVAVGHFATARNQDKQEIAQLQNEVTNMKQLVALSLMQQQSANDRLKGVTWAYRVERNDTEVLGALLETINHDPNVNVRLAAVDAIRNFADSPVARKGIAQSLVKQEDPLVQVTILSLIGELGVRQAAPQIRTLLTRDNLDGNVRQTAEKLLPRIE
jgi:cell division protein FtsL